MTGAPELLSQEHRSSHLSSAPSIGREEPGPTPSVPCSGVAANLVIAQARCILIRLHTFTAFRLDEHVHAYYTK